MIKEIWKPIEGYNGLYQVSNMGRVKSLERNVVKGKGGLYKIEEKILKGSKDKDGYLCVNLSKDGKVKTHKIHRLVAQAFLPNPNNLPQVNHRNENKTDNRVENLEYCDSKYNNNFGTRTEKTQKPILQFTKNGDFIKKWNSATQIQRELGFYNSHISNCCKGKYKSAYGYEWGYADDYERIPFRIFDLEIYRKKVS